MAKDIQPEITPTVAAMMHFDAPQTREEYILWAFLLVVGPDDEIDPELEAMMPAQFRRHELETRGGEI